MDFPKKREIGYTYTSLCILFFQRHLPVGDGMFLCVRPLRLQKGFFCKKAKKCLEMFGLDIA
jgi:hypothetical protein